MRTFELFEDHQGWTESAFRSHYGPDVREAMMRCCSGMPDDDWCKNTCRILMVESVKHVDDEGLFPVFGIDCNVKVLCCGGDGVENSTLETYCRECSKSVH